MRLILALSAWAALRRLGRPAFGLLASSGCLGLAGGHLGLIFGLLVGEALLGTRFDLGLGLGNGGQPLFATLELLRQAHTVRHRRLVGGRGQLEQFLHLGSSGSLQASRHGHRTAALWRLALAWILVPSRLTVPKRES